MNITIRPARQADDSELIALYNRVFDGHFDTNIWNWRYRQNPLRSRSFSMLAEANGSIASHYGASLVEFSVLGKPVLGALYIDAFTDPAVSGQKLFRKLGIALEEELKKAGVRLLLAFPNEISHRLFYNDLGWRDIVELPMLRAQDKHLRGEVKPDSQAAEVYSVTGLFDDMWDRLAANVPIWMVRNSKFIRYRFQSSAKYDYRIFGLFADENRKLNGYVILKPFAGGIDIMDVLAENNEVATRLLDHAIYEGTIAGASEFNAWLPVRHSLHHHLEKRGFENQAPVVYMMAKAIGELPDGSPDVFDARSWYYTMGDSDVY